jgi:hypothetical protein
MDLDKLADELLPKDGGERMSIAGENCRWIQEVYESEDIANPLIATTFWQAFIFSQEFANLVFRFSEGDYGPFFPEIYRYPEVYKQFYPDYKIYLPEMRFRDFYEGPTSIVLSHGTEITKRYDLIVFLPSRNTIQNPHVVNHVRISRQDIQDGWSKFLRSHSNTFQGPRKRITGRQRSRELNALLEYGAGAAIEAYEAQPFGVVFVPMPQLFRTKGVVVNAALPSQAMKVCEKNKEAEALATVGIISRNKSGKVGVTTALHALSGKRKRVWVGDYQGTVLTRDTWSDSCFIRVQDPSIMAVRGSKGPLIGKTPRSNEDVTFEGISSGKVSTIVIGWDPRLPYFERHSQFTVLTKPVTAPGDSGAALIDTDNNILGFAYSRTGFGERVEFAAWIWAQSVFANHNLL